MKPLTKDKRVEGCRHDVYTYTEEDIKDAVELLKDKINFMSEYYGNSIDNWIELVFPALYDGELVDTDSITLR